MSTNPTDIRTDTAPATNRRARRPLRWLLALLTLAATGLGGLALSEQTAGAASGSARATVCFKDQYGPVRALRVRSIVQTPSGSQWISDTRTTGNGGCVVLNFPAGRMLRITASKQLCQGSFCSLSYFGSGWIDARRTSPGVNYHLGTGTVTTLLNPNPGQVQWILNQF